MSCKFAEFTMYGGGYSLQCRLVLLTVYKPEKLVFFVLTHVLLMSKLCSCTAHVYLILNEMKNRHVVFNIKSNQFVANGIDDL